MTESASVTFEGRLYEIGTSCFLRVEFLNRPYPDSTLSWDRHVISCKVRVDAGAFKGWYSTDIYAYELAAIRAVLAALYERVGQEAEAAIDLLENAFEMKLMLTMLGHLHLEIIARAHVAFGPELHFSMEADQSHLPHWIKQLDQALALFPPELGRASPT